MSKLGQLVSFWFSYYLSIYALAPIYILIAATNLVFLQLAVQKPMFFQLNFISKISRSSIYCRLVLHLLLRKFLFITVNVYVPKDRVTNSHQGYGFVEFRSEEDADYVSNGLVVHLAVADLYSVCLHLFFTCIFKHHYGSLIALFLPLIWVG